MSFKDYELSLVPTFLLENDKDKYFEQSGEMKDLVVDATVDALQARFIESAPNDALLHIGVNDNIERPEIFTDNQYREKLKGVWDRWQKSGTSAQLIKEIRELGFSGLVSIVPQYVEVSPGNFIQYTPIAESNPLMVNFWSNFYVVVGLPHPFTQLLWGDWVWGDGTYWGDVKGDVTLLKRIVQLIKQLKPAHTSCRGVIFLLAPSNQWDNFDWGDGTLFGISKYAILRLREDWE